MNPEAAKNIVLISMVGTGLLVIADDIHQGKGIRGTHLLGLGLVYVGLSAAQDFAPKVAVPFAILVFVGVALTKGANLVNAIGNVSKLKGNFPAPGSSPSKALDATGSQTTSLTAAVVPVRKRVRTTGPSGVSNPFGGSN